MAKRKHKRRRHRSKGRAHHQDIRRSSDLSGTAGITGFLHPGLKLSNMASKLAVIALLLTVYALTIVRGIFEPNYFSEMHWLVGYEHGFIKRGFVATGFHVLQSLLPFVDTETLLHISAYTLLMLFYAVYFYVVVELVRNLKFSLGAVIIGLVFVSSPYIVMAGKVNGYYDNILAMLTVLACVLTLQGGRHVYGAAVALGIGVLIHESILLIGLPSVMVFALAKTISDNDEAKFVELCFIYAKRYWSVVSAPIFCGVAVFIGQDYFMDDARLRETMQQTISQHDFIPMHWITFFASMMTNGFLDYLSTESPCAVRRLTDGFFVSRILPASLAVLAFFYLATKRFRAKNLLFAAAFASVLLPMAMHIIAWDVERIWTYPVFAALIACFAFSRTLIHRDGFKIPIPLLLIMVYLLVAQNLTVYPLFDDKVDRLSFWVEPGLKLPFLPSSPQVSIGPCR